jgi:hypothetical protein
MFKKIVELYKLKSSKVVYDTNSAEFFANGQKTVIFDRYPHLEDKLKEKYHDLDFTIFRLFQIHSKRINFEVLFYFDETPYLFSVDTSFIESESKVVFHEYIVGFENDRLNNFYWHTAEGETHQKLVNIQNDFYQLVKEMDEYRLLFLTGNIEEIA